MTLAKRKSSTKLERWGLDDNKTVHYEFMFNGRQVLPGTTLTLKYDRTKYKFICLVHNIRLDTTWLELVSPEGYKSVRIDRVSKVLWTTKKSRAKKNAN